MNNKAVIYIDVDDEITSIIDKLRSSDGKIVALVLPKRATVFQSIVNMKLLKRTADHAKKHLVLITSEAGLLPLAGSVGVHVAHSLQSKPEIPSAPKLPSSAIENVEETATLDDDITHDPRLDQAAAVGDLASSAHAPTDVDDTIMLDDAEGAGSVIGPHHEPSAPGSKKAKKPKGGKGLKVPNFNKFRLWLVVGGVALVLFIGLLYLCLGVLPKASISVKTDSQSVSSNLQLRLSPSAAGVNLANNTVPVQAQQIQKTVTQQVDSTGQRNDGQKASGSVTMTAGPCSADVPSDVPAGTGLSANGLTYITESNASFSPSISGKKCTYQSSGVPISAQASGAQYNTGSASFSVAGNSGVTASTNGISGGSDQITKIVQQSDIDSAKQKLGTQDNASIKQELQSNLQDKGLFAITASFNTGSPDVSTSAGPGTVADNVTVTEKITYTMIGATRSNLDKVIDASVNKQIDTSKQKVLDYGLDQATFTFQNQSSNSAIALASLQVNSVAGSDLNTEALKKQVAGKKSGDAQSIIKANPGVTDVSVHYSPFWVSSIPKSTGKISVTIEKPQPSNDN